MCAVCSGCELIVVPAVLETVEPAVTRTVCLQIQNFLCNFCGGEERAHPGLQRRQQGTSGAAEGPNPPPLPAPEVT